MTAAKQYRVRADWSDCKVPERFFNVRIFDMLWRKMRAEETICSNEPRVAVTLEEYAWEVKLGSRKRGPTAAPVDGNKRHDLCVWIRDRPFCVIEVKNFGNRYGKLDEDIERLKSVVKGKNAPNFSVLAFHGYCSYSLEAAERHKANIARRYHNPPRCFADIRKFKSTDAWNLTGAIVVFNNRTPNFRK
ncbi:MAG: hypothetical protein F4039_09100 [Gammaproteobacteria bacterium]|nr:hypothetical protein [Gammaproteobacteria bacterium]MYK44227.1 hypothetical protein [Gammaproteobacteria bacterium]